jgi:hypothetical protein
MAHSESLAQAQRTQHLHSDLERSLRLTDVCVCVSHALDYVTTINNNTSCDLLCIAAAGCVYTQTY